VGVPAGSRDGAVVGVLAGVEVGTVNAGLFGPANEEASALHAAAPLTPPLFAASDPMSLELLADGVGVVVPDGPDGVEVADDTGEDVGVGDAGTAWAA
jgi:hypothetical protein